MKKISRRLFGIEPSIFARMTLLAQERKAINLAQGFPDFNGPRILLDRMHFYLDDDANQYTRSYGHPKLCEALEQIAKNTLPRNYNAVDEITVINGATEGILCTVLGLVDEGKNILVFEPYYESYLACAKMAQANLIGVPLVPPGDSRELEKGFWKIDWARFHEAIEQNVALIILNHPHNPTGKVFDEEELELIFSCAVKRGIIVALDGVYEHLVYTPWQERFLPFLAKYSENIIFISSISKTLSFTGFKIGWVFAPQALMPGIRKVHEAAVFCQAPHMQRAVADVILDQEFLSCYLTCFKEEYQKRRDMMRQVLLEFGFSVPNAQGSYFLLAKKHRAPLNAPNDHDMALELLENFGIATIPISGFYVEEAPLRDWLRFAFCKSQTTLERVKEALKDA